MTPCCSPAGVYQSVGGAYVCLVRLPEYEGGVSAERCYPPAVTLQCCAMTQTTITLTFAAVRT